MVGAHNIGLNTVALCHISGLATDARSIVASDFAPILTNVVVRSLPRWCPRLGARIRVLGHGVTHELTHYIGTK